MRPGLTKEDKQNIIRLYQEGKSPTEIGKIYNIKYFHVGSILKYNNIPRNQVKKITVDMEEVFAAEYAKGVSSEVIAKHFNVDGGTVRRAVRKKGLVIRPDTENKRKYNIDVDYFENINTEEKAYFLGLLYADGSLSSGGFGIKITLKDHDIDILEKLSNIIYGFRKLKESQTILLDKDNNEYISKYFTLSFYSKKMHQDLCKLGCTPRKSFTITFPDKIINPEFIRHFIRGYFDGDGCISVVDENKPRVDFTSNGDFIIGLKQFIEKTLNIDCNKIGQRHPDTATRNMQLSGFYKTPIILDYIYKDANIFMNRKRNKYYEMLEQLNNKKINLNNKYSNFSKYGTTYVPIFNNKILLEENLKTMSEEEKKEIASYLLDFYRDNGFPYPILTDDEIIKDFTILKNTDPLSILNDKALKLYNGAGIATFKHFSPHYFEVNCGNNKRKSMLETFNDDKLLASVIKNRLDGNYNMTGNMLKQGLPNSKIAYKSSIFFPVVAKFIYSKFTKENDIIYDYSMGFGQRLLGALSLKHKVKYIGTDPLKKSVESNNNIFNFMNKNIPSFNKEIDLYCDGSENFCDEKYINKVNLAFSSPPYFNLEIYSDEKEQACNNTYVDFINIYWRKTMENIKKLLTTEGLFILNTTEHVSGFNLLEDMSNVARELGFILIDEYKMQLTRNTVFNRSDGAHKYEPILVFRK